MRDQKAGKGTLMERVLAVDTEPQGYLMARLVSAEQIPALLTMEFTLDQGPSAGAAT